MAAEVYRDAPIPILETLREGPPNIGWVLEWRYEHQDWGIPFSPFQVI
jgi:hypothetical protein